MKTNNSRNKLGTEAASLEPKAMLAGTRNINLTFAFPSDFSDQQKNALRGLAEEAGKWVDNKVGGTGVYNLRFDFTQDLDGYLSTIYDDQPNTVYIDKDLAGSDLRRTSEIFLGQESLEQKNSQIFTETVLFELGRKVTGLTSTGRAERTVLANLDTGWDFNQFQQEAINSQPNIFYTDRDA